MEDPSDENNGALEGMYVHIRSPFVNALLDEGLLVSCVTVKGI